MAASTHTTATLKPSSSFPIRVSNSHLSSFSGRTVQRLEFQFFQNDNGPPKNNFFFGWSIQFKRQKSYFPARLHADNTSGTVIGSSPKKYLPSFDQCCSNHLIERKGILIDNYASQREKKLIREGNGQVRGSLDRDVAELFPLVHDPNELVQPVLLKSSRENWGSSFTRRQKANVQIARLMKRGELTEMSSGKCMQATPVKHEDADVGNKFLKPEFTREFSCPNASSTIFSHPAMTSASVTLQDSNEISWKSSESISALPSTEPSIGATHVPENLTEKHPTSTSKQTSLKTIDAKGKGPPIKNSSSPRKQLAKKVVSQGSSDVEGSGVNGLSLAAQSALVKHKEIVEDTSRCDIDAVVCLNDVEGQTESQQKIRSDLCSVYEKVLLVENIPAARRVVRMLTMQYRHLVFACDTEVSNIDVKQETPVDHGEITCFSIYGGEEADFGNGKSCIWVNILDGGGKDLLVEFAPFFEDSSIKKVWHNYSFDCHVVENYGIKLSGFHADTMHMARLWNSSRRLDGGYSLEALTSDPKIIPRHKSCQDTDLIGKVSMKSLFGRRKVKKDGSLGKIITIPPIEQIQREDRKPWICYSSLDSMSTLKLYESLKCKLSAMPWSVDGKSKGTMIHFYEYYWRPFGELLTKMETEGMLVDRQYLAEVEKVAITEQKAAADHFRSWATKYCPDAKYMNVGSDTQLRQLFFGGIMNSKNPNEFLPEEKEFKILNVDNVIKEGKKTPAKYRDIKLRRLSDKVIETELYTATGWPSVSGDALKALAGKVSADYDFTEPCELDLDDEPKLNEEVCSKDVSKSSYGTAYAAFNGGRKGKAACHAIAALCEVCSIDSLISNFILPLQGNHVSGKHGRIHCSLNINTETGRLSARRPNLQNQPALEKDRYKIRQAFIAASGNSLIVADYGQLELRILAHLAGCKSMMDAFEAGGDFHSRTAMNMYPYIREAVEQKKVLLEWHPQPGEEKPPVPLLKDAYGSERRKAKMLNFSIAYGKTPVGLARDWKVSVKEAKKTVDLWYKERKEVLLWQEERKKEAVHFQCVRTLLGRARHFPSVAHASSQHRGHIERAAINTPVQGSAADVAMCAMLEIAKNARLKELGWKLLLQVHDEVILEGPTESSEEAKGIVVECMSKPFNGVNFLNVELVVDAKCAQNWYAAK